MTDLMKILKIYLEVEEFMENKAILAKGQEPEPDRGLKEHKATPKKQNAAIAIPKGLPPSLNLSTFNVTHLHVLQYAKNKGLLSEPQKIETPVGKRNAKLHCEFNREIDHNIHNIDQYRLLRYTLSCLIDIYLL